MIIVGIDPHSRTHAAAAVDEHGRLLEDVEVAAGEKGLERLCAWIDRLPQPRLVAIENARGYGLALARRLIAQGEELVDVPAVLTCDGRRSSGQRGKHDQGDALVIARIALRDQERLPPAPVPASSGRVQRHRLNRGGNRQLNRALYTIAMVQARWEPAARVYLDRKLAEGKSAAEARRCLKRHLANVVYRALIADQQAPHLT